MHIVLVIMSILLSAFLSYTMFNNHDTTLLAVVGAIATLSLLYYFLIILKKFKTI